MCTLLTKGEWCGKDGNDDISFFSAEDEGNNDKNNKNEENLERVLAQVDKNTPPKTELHMEECLKAAHSAVV